MHVMDLKAALNGGPGVLETAGAANALEGTESQIQMADTNTVSKLEPK